MVEEYMKVVMVTPECGYGVVEVPDLELETMQSLVDGYIEAIPRAYYPTLEGGIYLIGNEEASLENRPPSLRVAEWSLPLLGSYILCGTTREEYVGLTMEQVCKAMQWINRWYIGKETTEFDLKYETFLELV